MKALLVLALSSLCATAMADEVPTDVAQQQPAVEEYTYSTHLDIAKVISMSEIPNVCEVVPATTTPKANATSFVTASWATAALTADHPPSPSQGSTHPPAIKADEAPNLTYRYIRLI
jgi:Protein of unknown function (DUF2790).